MSEQLSVEYDQSIEAYRISFEGVRLIMTGKNAADMVKQLYSLGLEFDMPSTDSYLQGRMEAMTEHLADMRRLVMDGLPGDK